MNALKALYLLTCIRGGVLNVLSLYYAWFKSVKRRFWYKNGDYLWAKVLEKYIQNPVTTIFYHLILFVIMENFLERIKDVAENVVETVTEKVGDAVEFVKDKIGMDDENETEATTDAVVVNTEAPSETDHADDADDEEGDDEEEEEEEGDEDYDDEEEEEEGDDEGDDEEGAN